MCTGFKSQFGPQFGLEIFKKRQLLPAPNTISKLLKKLYIPEMKIQN